MKRALLIKIILFFTLAFFATLANAAVIYLQAKQYLDVKSGKFIQPANLLIENGKIIAINPANVPATATIVRRQLEFPTSDAV